MENDSTIECEALANVLAQVDWKQFNNPGVEPDYGALAARSAQDPGVSYENMVDW